jgi:ABC-type antimicrobial peptide transport system permease subunit
MLPAAFVRAMENKDPNLNGPELVFVRLSGGVSRVDGLANLVGITDAANRAFDHDPRATGDEVSVLGVQRPAEIVNYRTIGSTPIFLAVALALGAVVALGVTLGASVRRRRRDLALLKTLGFTRRQASEAVAWQAMIDSVCGVALGIPLGVICGRQLWTAFANTIYAVPYPTVPALSIVVVGIGALVFGILAAALPSRAAARIRAGLTLRVE